MNHAVVNVIETAGSVQGGEFVDQLSDCGILMKNFAHGVGQCSRCTVFAAS